ncbi:recombination-associated protein RdgC [Thorsellia anophelis]|uniref:Recombination-associated protein RdgC n=1 Tax=Thorsellia anophelis DSM 18579 TaxID=1123402 RepID=A0A1I0D9D8_9GAMM|nr:recombination-associated protein RdgC [Thorsellia anophelis]SET28826.1 recombination associated protein RdgC [Thorsellia anophelis DSM 18579]
MFKSLMIFKLKQAIELSNDVIAAEKFMPCESQDLVKMGFVPPLDISESYVHNFGKSSLLVIRKEEKILPSSVIAKAVYDRIQEIENARNIKLSKAERATVKQEVIVTLMPRAFSKFTQVKIWVDHENERISVDTSSAKQAELVLGLLRRVLGSLPVVPFGMFETPVSRTITNWVTNEFPHYLEFDGKLKIVDEDNATATFKDSDLNDEMVELACSGEVKQIGLNWREKINFVLDEDFKVKNIKFSEFVLDQRADDKCDDYAQRFDADLILYTAELNDLIADLVKTME